MAVERGSAFLLKVGDGAASPAFATVAGMRTTSMSINGEAVAVTHKGSGGWRELLGGANVTFSVVPVTSASVAVSASPSAVTMLSRLTGLHPLEIGPKRNWRFGLAVGAGVSGGVLAAKIGRLFPTLAGIGKIESDHGSAQGATLRRRQRCGSGQQKSTTASVDCCPVSFSRRRHACTTISAPRPPR